MKIHQHNADHMTKMAAIQYMVKTLKNLLSKNHWADFDETLYETSAPLIFCSNYDPVLTLTYFMARSNYATKAFIWDNVTMMDSLEITASCDLESC